MWRKEAAVAVTVTATVIGIVIGTVIGGVAVVVTVTVTVTATMREERGGEEKGTTLNGETAPILEVEAGSLTVILVGMIMEGGILLMLGMEKTCGLLRNICWILQQQQHQHRHHHHHHLER